jgi:hypothetical protein
MLDDVTHWDEVIHDEPRNPVLDLLDECMGAVVQTSPYPGIAGTIPSPQR